ncbi:MAG: hypothetical protein JWP59_1795 [Massilia sp.]|nr:hypothetical protein [Massilia sp.]
MKQDLAAATPAARLALGKVALKNKQVIDALRLFQSILDEPAAVAPKLRTRALMNKGFCLQSLEKWESAELAIGQALARTSRPKAKSLFRHAQCLLKLRRTAAAAAALTLAVKRAPRNARYRKTLDSVMCKLGQAGQVESGLRAQLQRESANLALWTRLVAVLELGDDHAALETACRAALAIDGGNAALQARHGGALRQLGRHQDAADAYRRALALNENEPRWHVALADSLSAAQDGAFRPALRHTHTLTFSGKAHATLYIVFSPYKNRHILLTRAFDGDTLHIHEKRLTYYTYNRAALMEAVVDLVREHGYARVCMIGASKGGFGALAATAIAAARLPATAFHAVAFSPQTALWPKNENIARLPSYSQFLKASKSSATTRADLRENGALDWLRTLRAPNLSGTVVFGDAFERDKVEALRLQGVGHLELMPIPLWPLHSTAALFTREGEALRQVVSVRYAKASDDAYFTPANAEELADRFFSNPDSPRYKLESLLAPWLAATASKRAA